MKTTQKFDDKKIQKNIQKNIDILMVDKGLRVLVKMKLMKKQEVKKILSKLEKTKEYVSLLNENKMVEKYLKQGSVDRNNTKLNKEDIGVSYIG